MKIGRLGLIGILLSAVVGFALKAPPSDPDALVSISSWIGVFLLFISFAAALLAWGFFWVGLLRLDIPSFAPVLGSAWCAFLMLELGTYGLIGQRWVALDCFVLFLGVPLALYRFKAPWTMPRLQVADGLFVVLLLAFLAAGLTLSPHPDPLYYHLLGPRAWFDTERIRFAPGAPLYNQCGYWESLYLWADVFLAGEPGTGLFEAQVFSQWTHALFGFGAAYLMLRVLLKNWIEDVSWCALFAVCTSACLIWEPAVAKPDWGVIAWVVAGLAVYYHSRGREILSGVLIGLGIASKWTILYFAAPWLGLTLMTTREGWKVCLAVIVACAPIWFRNVIPTGNPFFPVLDGIFPSRFLSVPLKEYFAGFTQFGLSFKRLQIVVFDLVLSAPLSLGIFLFPLSKKSARLIGALTISLLLLATTMGPYYFAGYWRILGPAPVLAAAMGAVAVRKRLGFVPLLVIGGALSVWSIASSHALAPLAEIGREPALQIRAHAGGDAKAWLRLNTKPGDLIFTGGDTQLYYVSGLRIVRMEEDAALESALSRAVGARGIVRELRLRGGKYLLDTWRFGAPLPWGKTMARLYPALMAHKDAVAYQGASARVFDLVKLAELVSKDGLAMDQEPKIQGVVSP